MVKCNVMMASRWSWVVDGGTVLLGNVIRFPWWCGVIGEFD